MMANAWVLVRLLATLVPAVLFDPGVAAAAQLTASWVDNSGGLAATRLERRLGTGTEFTVVAEVPPGLTSHVDRSVSLGSTYCYRVRAQTATAVSPYSAEACATARDDGLQLTVSKTGDGAGSVVSSPTGLDCGGACAAAYPSGTTITLTATPAAGSSFAGWSGGCAGTAPCTVVGNVPTTVTATFARTSSSGALWARCGLPAGEVTLPYSAGCRVGGGTPPYACSLAAGRLPWGLSLGSDCRVTGTPGKAGPHAFTVRVADGAGSARNASASLAVLQAVTVRTAALQPAPVDKELVRRLVAAGGKRPYTWALTAGSLPVGLGLDGAEGVIRGLPTTTGISRFTVQVRDALGKTTERALDLVVNLGPLSATCASPPAEVDIAYSTRCRPRGGLPPYSCVLASGAPPAGLTLNSDCSIAGTPTTPGAGTFTTSVVDSSDRAVKVSARLIVRPAVAVQTATLPAAILSQRYVARLVARGGWQPFTWSLSGGELPPGVTLDPSRGTLGGIPKAKGTTSFTVTVTDAYGARDRQTLRLAVLSSPELTVHCASFGQIGVPYAGCSVVGGVPPYTCLLMNGQPPPGLRVDDTCSVGGVPTTAESTTFELIVSDATGASATAVRTITTTE